MFRTLSPTSSSTISQLSINAANKDEVGGVKIGGNETNLSNPFTSKKFTKAGYLIFKSAKKSDGNTKKCVKAARGSNYLIPDIKKSLITYGMHLHKRLSFNTLTRNSIYGLKLTREIMPLVKS